MTFDDILLALIARRSRSGYELKKWLDIEGVFIRANADQSQIYRTLRRLERYGFITHEIVRKGGPDAKIHRITTDGVQYLRDLADTPYDPPARWQEADFVARISLLGPVSPASIQMSIEREIAFRQEQIARFRGREQDLTSGSGPIEFDSALIEELGAAMDEFGRDSMDMWLAFLERQRVVWSTRIDHGASDDPVRESSASSSSS